MFDITSFEIISGKERSASNTFLAINRLLISSQSPFQESNIIKLCKHYALTRSFSATPTQYVCRRFPKQSKHQVLSPKNQSIGVFINQEFFTLSNQSIMHFYLLMLRAKQSIMSFPQSPGANESPLAELTTFSARVNVTPFSINWHRVDKGPRIWVESTRSSKRCINRGFSLIVELKFDSIHLYPSEVFQQV